MSKNPENQWKLTKIVDIDGEILHNNLMNFNYIFRKDVTYVTYDNIKSQGGGEGVKLNFPAVLGLVKPKVCLVETLKTMIYLISFFFSSLIGYPWVHWSLWNISAIVFISIYCFLIREFSQISNWRECLISFQEEFWKE